MKMPNGTRQLTYTGQPGVTCRMTFDENGANSPYGRLHYVEGPPDLYLRPAPPSPEIAVRFTTPTDGVALLGGDVLLFTHAPAAP